MHRPARIGILALLVVLGLGAGCAHLGFGPRALLDEANAAIDARDYPTAYGLLKRIALEYPDSPESAEAFPLAAGCLKVLYHHDRYRQPDSVWITSEPRFMFEWLTRYFEAGSPELAVSALFVGCPYNVLREFEEYAKGNPYVSQWVIRAEDDNGIIRSVTAERADAPAS